LILREHNVDSSQVQARLDAEDSRTLHYLSAQTQPALQQILKNHLLTAQLSAIIAKPHSGLDFMIDEKNFDDLKLLYQLVSTVPDGLPCLIRSLKESIGRRGKSINRASEGVEVDVVDVVNEVAGDEGGNKGKAKMQSINAKQTLAFALQWVQDVLDMRDIFDQIWKRSLCQDRELECALDAVRFSFILVMTQ
jgi:cullin 3